jgi:hypothetical protein
VLKDVVRGFGLVLHDTEGSHYENSGVENLANSWVEAKIKARAKLKSL